MPNQSTEPKYDPDTPWGWAHKAGEMDSYYGRPPKPHYHGLGSKLWGVLVDNPCETTKQAYLEGYFDNTERKDWGLD